jgi:hypothetical protein
MTTGSLPRFADDIEVDLLVGSQRRGHVRVHPSRGVLGRRRH